MIFEFNHATFKINVHNSFSQMSVISVEGSGRQSYDSLKFSRKYISCDENCIERFWMWAL